MKYFSVCSGIEAASCAWEALGWKPVGFSEIEPFPSAVLAYRFPDVKNYGDMTKYKEWENVGQFDVLVGGTPCQSFSVAGLRKGLDDPRGNLMLTFGAITNHFRPTWIVWENVPGVLSSNGGRDFGTFLGMLAELGYGFAYRILDAQFFGVPQRRRRVFVVGCLGDWRRAAAVLFESESLRGDNPPSREAREGAARGIEIGPSGGGFTDVNPTLDTRRKDGPIRNQLAGAVMVSHTLRGEGFDASENGTGRGTPIVPVQCFERNTPDGHARLVGDIAPTLNRMGGGQREPCIFMPVIMATGQGNAEISENRSPTLNCNHEAPILAHMTGAGYWKEGAGTLRAREQDSHENLVIQSTVRRITPRECERLQGFPEERKSFILSPCVEEKKGLAPSVAQSSQAPNQGVKERALVNVLIDFDLQRLQLHKAGKLLLSASFADAKNSFLRHTQGEDFARLIALMKQEGDKIITTGKAESPRVNVLSSHQPNGSIFANLYGLETEELASGAGQFMSGAIEHLKSITSQAGKSSLNLEQKFLTLSFFVASAINGFIQEKTQTENISPIRVETVCGWTKIPWRGKPADECPDGNRYKACGNSMAVPVMLWIGERIKTYILQKGVDSVAGRDVE